MILFEGKLLSDDELDNVLDKLWDSCVNAIANREDIAERVINACECVADKIKNGEYDAVLNQLLEKGLFTKEQLEEVSSLFDRKNLQLKYDIELGNFKKDVENAPYMGRAKYVEPMGLLFHIAAGNAEGLPFYSVLEGMLAGNVNILKLPSMDDGVSVMLLHEMIKVEPSLAAYICVLDVPSTNLVVMKRLADMADAVVVWGGDEAIKAIRTYADPKTNIISWGHKLSFAYVTKDVLKDAKLQEELYALARHICETKQVLCSSCQGIFVDSKDMQTVERIGYRFFDILREVSGDFPPETIGVRGKTALSLYNEELENADGRKKIYKGDGISVVVDRDSELELSFMFRNCWVKPLARKNIVRTLKGNTGHLQTVGLICTEAERSLLAKEFAKAGLVRINRGGNMSHTLPGEAHDGEYPLRRYSRIVEVS